jgi:hypothetical protein
MAAKPATAVPATEAVIEAGTTKGLAAIAGRGPSLKDENRPGLRQLSRRKSWQDAQRSPARNKGRRTMGRGSGR